MNVYEIYQRKFLAFPSMSLVPVNNTTKRIQNYLFKLNQVLGKGNFSTVYRGINELTNEPVAIKVVQLSSITTPALLDLLYSQIQILKTLNHPNIMKCHEVFTSANNCYIITELCLDGNLEKRIQTRGPMAEKEASKTIYQMFQGLKYLAEQGIVHRDFKVANILVNKGVAKIADFGFAKRTKDRFKDMSVGSPMYMSPQGLLESVYGPKTDVWAFGVFVYEILHGDTPLSFCHSQQELKVHIMNPLRMEKFHPSISIDLRELVLRCMEVNENRRIGIFEIEQTSFIKRVSWEFGGINARGLQGFHGLTPKTPHQTSKGFLPPRAVKYNNVGNQRANSPQTGIFDQQTQRKNYSFQNLMSPSNGIITPQRGVSVQHQNFASHQHSYSQDAKHKPNSQQYLGKADPTCKIVSKYCTINYYECVSLLHYCRLAYKIAIQLAKLQRLVGVQMKEYFLNWLFQVFNEVELKVPSQIRFEGKKAAVREKKLQDVIQEYHKKYFSELVISMPLDASLQGIQQAISTILKAFDEKINKQPYNTDRKELIITAHYLEFMYEANLQLEKSKQMNYYQDFMKNCALEQFMAIRKENYDDNSYKVLRPKISQFMAL